MSRTARTPAYVQDARAAASDARALADRLQGEIARLEKAITANETKREAGLRTWTTGTEVPKAVLAAGIEVGALSDRLTLTRSDLEAATTALEQADAALAEAELRHDLQTARDAEDAAWPRILTAINELAAVTREVREATEPVMVRATDKRANAYFGSLTDRTRPWGLHRLLHRLHDPLRVQIADRLRRAGLDDLLAKLEKGR